MGYKNSKSFHHGQADKVGILITNLGTPAAPNTKALRTYLKQFLSDPRVVEFPRLLWWLVLNGIILQIRPRKSAHAYRQVWTEDGSPLALHTRDQANALRERLEPIWGDDLVLAWAMRYGTPSIEDTVDSMLERGVRRLLVLPLYPQYSASTTASTFDALAADFTARRWIPELRFVTSYHDFPPYIEALATSIRQFWEAHGQAPLIVFSYHGVPQRYLHNGDPYHCQCHHTSRLLATALGLTEGQFMTTFQSRFGREPWLQPYTDHTMESLPGKGIKQVQVVCPGFSSDCLETIEEIAMENRDIFIEAGGESFGYIPCLNAQPAHIEALAQLAEKQLTGWHQEARENIEEREVLYQKHKDNRKD